MSSVRARRSGPKITGNGFLTRAAARLAHASGSRTYRRIHNVKSAGRTPTRNSHRHASGPDAARPRISAGDWRGRPLQAPAGQGTRPTSDRTRETLFSMLVSRLGSFEGLRVADLYAGSGALGLEALSRGAGHATFVEKDLGASRVGRAVHARTSPGDRSTGGRAMLRNAAGRPHPPNG